VPPFCHASEQASSADVAVAGTFYVKRQSEKGEIETFGEFSSMGGPWIHLAIQVPGAQPCTLGRQVLYHPMVLQHHCPTLTARSCNYPLPGEWSRDAERCQ